MREHHSVLTVFLGSSLRTWKRKDRRKEKRIRLEKGGERGGEERGEDEPDLSDDEERRVSSSSELERLVVSREGWRGSWWRP